MTSSSNSDSVSEGGLDSQQIADFLRHNPSFFEHHSGLLTELSIPHDSGGAVSLVERQLDILRKENTRLSQQLDSLLTTARQNERLNANIHKLALSLLDAVGPQAIFGRLESRLREDFAADHVAIRVFADGSMIDVAQLPQFVGADSKQRIPFARLFESQATVCGPLDDGRHEVLFNDIRGRLSAVTMPLAGLQWDGILVIASSDADRYQADMGTEFLTYLKDVVALVIDPWVKRDSPAAG